MKNDRNEVVRVFAPATVANLGPGFDVLGLAVEGIGDVVSARLSTKPGVSIIGIDGDAGALSLEATSNTAGIAAIETLKLAGVEASVELFIEKGMPLGSGLGSSAASAAAAAMAVNLLVGSPLRKADLVGPCVEAEAAVSGRHADNVAPSVLGGLILVRSVDPLDLVRLPVPQGLTVVVSTPAFELPTREARAALPADVPLARLVEQTANVAAIVSACYSGNLALLGRSVRDEIVTPARAALIPGGARVIEAALDAGAIASSISGAGPSIFALCRSERSAQKAAEAMTATFSAAGLDSVTLTSSADCPGARRL
jgi:homoserine kinase